MNLVAGLERPTGGSILLDGREVTGPGADRTVMFQDHGLYPWLTVMENVTFGMKLAGLPKEEREKKAEHYLDMVHLSEYRDYPIQQISGGMRQRTALARALTMDSDVLLMDEPFSALDKQTRLTVGDDIGQIIRKEGKSALLVTHDLSEAVTLADRVLVLSKRPASIKCEMPIQFSIDRRDPMAVRNTAEYQLYFNHLWEVLTNEQSVFQTA